MYSIGAACIEPRDFNPQRITIVSAEPWGFARGEVVQVFGSGLLEWPESLVQDVNTPAVSSLLRPCALACEEDARLKGKRCASELLKSMRQDLKGQRFPQCMPTECVEILSGGVRGLDVLSVGDTVQLFSAEADALQSGLVQSVECVRDVPLRLGSILGGRASREALLGAQESGARWAMKLQAAFRVSFGAEALPAVGPEASVPVDGGRGYYIGAFCRAPFAPSRFPQSLNTLSGRARLDNFDARGGNLWAFDFVTFVDSAGGCMSGSNSCVVSCLNGSVGSNAGPHPAFLGPELTLVHKKTDAQVWQLLSNPTRRKRPGIVWQLLAADGSGRLLCGDECRGSVLLCLPKEAQEKDSATGLYLFNDAWELTPDNDLDEHDLAQLLGSLSPRSTEKPGFSPRRRLTMSMHPLARRRVMSPRRQPQLPFASRSVQSQASSRSESNCSRQRSLYRLRAC